MTAGRHCSSSPHLAQHPIVHCRSHYHTKARASQNLAVASLCHPTERVGFAAVARVHEPTGPGWLRLPPAPVGFVA